MDLLKIAIFIAAFLLLIFLGRLLSAHAESTPYPGPGPLQPEAALGPVLVQGGKQPAITGAEFGFPISLPPIKRDELGKYNRPHFLNYHFRQTDLQTGPPDPACFCDDFFLQAQDPESQHDDDFFLHAQDPESRHVWTYKYLVATPAGLQKVMNDEKYVSLFFDGPVVVVARWDLKVILSTVVEEILKSYGHPDDESLYDIPTAE